MKKIPLNRLRPPENCGTITQYPCSGIEVVITGLTRNFLKSWLFAPLKKPVKSGVFSGSKIEYFVVLSVSSFQKFLEEMRNYIHGELSEWSKVQHSKCCVPKRNLGFESLTLRQKSPKNQGFSGFYFLPFCSKSAQNYGKNSLFFGKNKAISGILAYSNRKNQFFPPSFEISLHLLPKFTDSGSAIPLTIAFAEESFEV